MVTKVCFHRSIITLKMDADYSWRGCGGGGVIPKYMKALLQVLNVLTVITVSLFVSQPLQSF